MRFQPGCCVVCMYSIKVQMGAEVLPIVSRFFPVESCFVHYRFNDRLALGYPNAGVRFRVDDARWYCRIQVVGFEPLYLIYVIGICFFRLKRGNRSGGDMLSRNTGFDWLEYVIV